MQTLKLIKPIMINGIEFKELKYDFESMTAIDRIAVGKHAKGMGMNAYSNEIDSDYHILYFAKACEKADSSVNIDDVLRISFKDSVIASSISRNFIFATSVASTDQTTEASEASLPE